MDIIYIETIDSTHTYLKELIKNNEYKKPLCIYTNYQTNGIGSRGNSWQGQKGNLFFSFVIHKNLLPKDLPMQSTSIYFSFLLKKVLEQKGSEVWLKWPNDFYMNDKKIGGTITNLTSNLFYCGVGLNLLNVDEEFGFLDIQIDSENLLKEYFNLVELSSSWKNIFSEFKIEFQRSRSFKATINDKKISLESAMLCDDGSIEIDQKKVYSLR